LYLSPDIRGILSRRIYWVVHLTQMELEIAYTILVGKFEGKGLLARIQA
jgi:hypothetical protein